MALHVIIFRKDASGLRSCDPGRQELEVRKELNSFYLKGLWIRRSREIDLWMGLLVGRARASLFRQVEVIAIGASSIIIGFSDGAQMGPCVSEQSVYLLEPWNQGG